MFIEKKTSKVQLLKKKSRTKKENQSLFYFYTQKFTLENFCHMIAEFLLETI